MRRSRLCTLSIGATLVAVGAGCAVDGDEAPTSAVSEALGECHTPNPELFPKDAHPYGASMATWGDRLSQWIYEHPFEHNPLFDQTGADCGIDQHGPVWFLPRIGSSAPVFSGTRSCTIPRHKAILLQIGNAIDTYPCPDPNFHPAPGQSLYDFLTKDAKPVMDTVNLLEVSIDGKALSNVMSYRYVSNDIFHITGDPSLVQKLDPCITGKPQPAISDGFFMMFKPLEPGQHTLHVHGTNTIDQDKTYLYNLTVD